MWTPGWGHRPGKGLDVSREHLDEVWALVTRNISMVSLALTILYVNIVTTRWSQ